jgi:hypothetical protein
VERSSLPLLLSLSSLALAGCATQGPWRELRTDHFMMATRADNAEALRQATRLETALASLASLAPGHPLPSRVDILWLPGEEDADALVPQSTGYFLPHQPGVPSSPPLIVVGGASGPALRARMMHELAHLVFVDVAPEAPPWVAEGLAGWYATLDFERGTVGAGVDDRDFLTSFRNAVAITVDKLLHANDATFHAVFGGRIYHRAARDLVAMLMRDPELRPRFDEYLARLSRHEPPPDAWRATLGALSSDDLERRFQSVAVRPPAPTAITRWTGAPTMTMLPAAAVERWMARARPWDSRESLIAAGNALARAVADDSAERHYWAGVYAARWHRWHVAEEELRAAVAKDPVFTPARTALGNLHP